MTITLQRFANGDTNYVAKHNSNLDSIEAAMASIEILAGNSAASSGANVAQAFRALFGASASLIGANSYLPNGSGANLTVQSGYCWRPSLNAVVSKSTSTIINFTGVTAGIWYIAADNTGNPIRTADSTEAAYSVAWDGSNFGLITKLLPIVWGAADNIAAQTSTALGSTFTSLDARLEAGESQASAGNNANSWSIGRLSKSIAGSSNVSLTAIEARNIILNFTGAITANLNVSITLSGSPRAWLVINNTTGNFDVTLKGSTGAGVKLPRAGQAIWVYSDGTNIIGLPRKLIHDLPFASTVTADFALADTIKMTLTDNSTITLSGATDKQKCVLELKQDGVGSRTITLNNHRFGSDITSITLSSAPNLTDKIGFIYDSAADKYDVVALIRGF